MGFSKDNEIVYNKIEQNDKFILVNKDENKSFILINDEKITQKEYERAKKFKNIEINALDIEGIDKVSYEFILKENYIEHTEWVYDLLKNSSSKSFSEILSIIEGIFEKENLDNFLKFRGDFGEALYIYHNEGSYKNMNDLLSYDIEDNGRMIEVKTMGQSNIITVSKEQLSQNVDIYYVLLRKSNDSLNIIELANSIKDIHFRKYLINKYENSEYKNIKFELCKPLLFKDKETIMIKDQNKLIFDYKMKLKMNWE